MKTRARDGSGRAATTRATLALALACGMALTASAAAGTRPAAKLLPDDGAAGDWFGRSVAVSGDTLVVGAQLDDDSGTDSGSAYVFRRSASGTWQQEQKLLPLDGAASDSFGLSVAVCGETAVVGALADDDLGSSSGSAYVFRRASSGVWVQEAKLTAADGAAGHLFGWTVSIEGDTVVVGTNSPSAEAAYVFHRDASGAWSQEARLSVADDEEFVGFGTAVAVSGDTAVVGARSAAVGGAAYVFRRGATGIWTRTARLTAIDAAAGDSFGWSVALSGDDALVGAYQDDDSGNSSGSAYVFHRDAPGTWTQADKLTASEAAADQLFGWSVALSGDTALVGAYQDDDDGTDSGSAHVYRRGAAGTWTHTAELHAPDAAAGDVFGWSVALSGDTAVVAARLDDDFGTDSGSAWAFPLETKLTATDAAQGAFFGASVALSGDTAVVGVPANARADTERGSARVFRRSAAGGWTATASLVADDASIGALFGTSVAVSGDTVLVGAPADTLAGSDAGGAWVFRRSAFGSWSREARLVAADGASGDRFGESVAVSGDTAAVGAYGHSSTQQVPQNGSVYVYRRAGSGAWTQEARLDGGIAAGGRRLGISVALSGDILVAGSTAATASVFRRDATGAWSLEAELTVPGIVAADEFGAAVAVAGDTVVVGAPARDGVGIDSGAAWIFRRSPAGAWSQVVELSAPDAAAGDGFGSSVAAAGDAVVVGCPAADGDGADSGSAHVFRRDAASRWRTVARLSSSDAAAGDRFGAAVAVSGDTALVGVALDDDGGSSAGSAYAFGDVGGSAALEIVTAALPDSTLGAAYDLPLVIAGGVRPRRFEIAWGALPPALVLDAATGRLHGTCSAYGAYAFVVRATDACGAEATRAFGLTVHPVPAVLTTSLAAATAGRTCTRQLAATGGAGVLRWSLASGVLPVAGTLDAATGAFSGTPLAPGSYVFTARVTDDVGVSGQASFSVRVNAAPQMAAIAPIATTTGRAIDIVPTLQGGSGPLVWTLAAGQLPVAGTPEPATGRVAGAALAPGAYAFTLRVTDAESATASRAVSVVVNPEPRFAVDALRPGVVARPYAAALHVAGGTSPLTFEVVEGALPEGVTLGAATGALAGVPAAPGRAAFRVRCTDAVGAATERGFTLDAFPAEDLSKGRLASTLHFDRLDGTDPVTRVLELVEGTRLDVSVRFRSAGAAPVVLDVEDATGASVAGDAVRKESARGVSLGGLVIPASGRYMVRVTPTAPFEGEVRLSVKVGAPGSTGGSLLVAEGGSATVRLATLAGARVAFTVKPARGGAAEPTILSVRDETGSELLVASDVKLATKSAALRLRDPAPGGALTLTLGTRGAAGELVWRAQVKNPRGYVHSAPDLPAGDGE